MADRCFGSYTEITTLILACYGRYNTYRLKRVGMQDITRTDQLVKHDVTQDERWFSLTHTLVE